MCETCAACCMLQGKWGEDLYSPVPRPMFLVRLVIVAGQLMYDPPLDTIEQAVLEAFDAIVLRSANIDEITTKVSLGAACAARLMHLPTHHALHVSPLVWQHMHACLQHLWCTRAYPFAVCSFIAMFQPFSIMLIVMWQTLSLDGPYLRLSCQQHLSAAQPENAFMRHSHDRWMLTKCIGKNHVYKTWRVKLVCVLITDHQSCQIKFWRPDHAANMD